MSYVRICHILPEVSYVWICHILPEVSHVHAGWQEIIIVMLDFVVRLAVKAPPAFLTTWWAPQQIEQRGFFFELPLHYIHWEYSYRKQTEKIKAEYFLISREGHIFYSMGLTAPS
jgi:hypothetical protein